jgi:amino acid adenylation domain-containing protein
MALDSLLWNSFVATAERHPGRPALSVGAELSYAELARRARCLAATIQRDPSKWSEPPLTAVFAYRSETAFAGVLGALAAGHGYVPLNRTFPVDRTRLMLKRSGCRAVIVDTASELQLAKILPDLLEGLLLIYPERSDTTELAAAFPRHRFVGADDLAGEDEWRSPEADRDSIAYLLFTSGSTGQPKGVMVSHANVEHYVTYVSERGRFNCEDRMSQTFDMTFDLSAHDMFVAWRNGACVCCPSQKELIKPGAFINRARLSVWFSVPSMAGFMRRLGILKENMYPGLRLSLFCGEALPVEIVRDWRLAAPNSIIENIYGPTELTIACTAYRWQDATSPDECEHGVVPIGEPFEGMEALVLDKDLRPVADGSPGELVMTGPQISSGYWQDEQRTQSAFVTVPNMPEKIYYRTGDRVRRRAAGKPLTYLGRLDSQIKILGHRVELGEVESVVRDLAGYDGVVALGWPATAKGADAIEVFLQTDECDTQRLLEQLRRQLPPYMVPRHVRLLSRFPLNSNGKFDRGALLKILESAEAGASAVDSA